MAQKIATLHQKGGCGKTTINVLIANYLAHKSKTENSGKKVLLIDCDKNKSLTNARNSDLAQGYQVDESYKFITISASDLMNVIEHYDNKYDYIVFDLPGAIHEDGILTSYMLIDHIFIPLILAKLDAQTTVDFYNLISTQLPEFRKKAGLTAPTINGIHNKIVLSAFDDKLYVQDGITPYTMIPSLKSYIPASQYFKTNINTVGLFDNFSKKSELITVLEEIYNIVK